MKGKDGVDLGSIKIHRKVIADVVHAVLTDLEGVSPLGKDLSGNFKEWFGDKSHPGIRIVVDKENKVDIDVQIKIQYGLNIPEVARSTQDAIRKMLEKTVDVDFKNINVNVQGIERGK